MNSKIEDSNVVDKLKLQAIKEINFPHSIGLSNVDFVEQYIRFKINSKWS